MFKKRLKPTLRKIDLSRLIAQDLEYFCKTSLLDELVCKRLKRDFNKMLADSQEQFVRFYFIVKKNQEYDVVPGPAFEKWLEENNVKELPQSTKAKLCVDHYVNACYQDLKD